MKNKKKLIVFALTASLLLSGCSLEKESGYEDISITPVIVEAEEVILKEDMILKSYVLAPSNEEEVKELMNYIYTLDGDYQIVIYDSNQKNNQDYHEDIFMKALKYNPMIQIYFCGSGSEGEKALALLYPNVTYVNPNENVEEEIRMFYKTNQICGYFIKAFREGQKKVENFDIEEAISLIYQKVQNVDLEDIKIGAYNFCTYIKNSEIFEKCEEVSEKVSDVLEPYVEMAIPKIEETWNYIEPYIEKKAQDVKETYEEIQPELSSAYESTKEYVKNNFLK